MSLTSAIDQSFLSVKCNHVGFMAVPKKSSSGNLHQIPGRTFSMSTKGPNLTYMPQGNVEQGDDAYLGAKPTAN